MWNGDRQWQRRHRQREVRGTEHPDGEARQDRPALLGADDRDRDDRHLVADRELGVPDPPLLQLVALPERLGRATHPFREDRQQLAALEQPPHVGVRPADDAGPCEQAADERQHRHEPIRDRAQDPAGAAHDVDPQQRAIDREHATVVGDEDRAALRRHVRGAMRGDVEVVAVQGHRRGQRPVDRPRVQAEHVVAMALVVEPHGWSTSKPGTRVAVGPT